MGKAFKLDNEVLASSISSLQSSLNSHAGTAATGSVLGHVKTGTGLANSSGTISVSYGTAAGTACQGNDSRLSNSRTPVAHATSATTYGGGTASNYGHVKLSDSYTSSGGAASESVGASSKAVYDAYTALKNSFQAGVDTIYNAFVNAGTTPTAKTPAALSTAVTTLKNDSMSFSIAQISLSHPYPNQGYTSSSKVYIDVSKFNYMKIGSITTNSGSLGVYDGDTTTLISASNNIYNVSKYSKIRLQLGVAASSGWCSVDIKDVTFYN